jgi:hypothetical protein
MSLLPPFEISKVNRLDEIMEELQECVSDFFIGVETPMSIEFTSIGIMEKKRPFVYLRPNLPENIIYLQELVHEILCSHDVKFKSRGKNFFEMVLPIAKPRFLENLGPSVKEAADNFTLPLQLFTGQFSLFEKFPGQWIIKEGIYQFVSHKTDVDDDFYGNIHQG